jgi:hypothetical protein
MDRLDDVLLTAQPLLKRVDELLSTMGAPAEHEVWAQVRRVRLLPGDAAQAVAALRPSALGEAGPEIRADARSCREVAAGLPPPGEWTGTAAEAYDEGRRRMAAHLSGDRESLDERLEETADLADALLEWMEQTRDALARALAEALRSREAVTLAGGDGRTPDGRTPAAVADVLAAADIAALVLRTVADHYGDATELVHGSAHLTEAIPM